MTFHNIARMYTETTGTGTVTLTTAVPGCLTFDLAGVSNAEVVRYGMITYSLTTNRPTHTEVGTGTYTTSGTTLSRTTVESSTNGGSKITLTGLTEVYLCPLASDLDGMVTEYPNNAVMWHDQSIILAGNARTTVFDANHRYNYLMYQNAAANNDEWTNGFVCAAGTYSINFLTITDADRGMLDVYVDDVSVATGLDFYLASVVRNTVISASGIVLTAGYHTLRCKVNGKHASSTGYRIPLSKIYLLPASY